MTNERDVLIATQEAIRKAVTEAANEEVKKLVHKFECKMGEIKREMIGKILNNIDVAAIHDPECLGYTIQVNINKALGAVKEESVKNHSSWVYWEGWCGNHDLRIEDAVCAQCGYKHPTVRWEQGDPREDAAYNAVLSKLADECPKCGSIMQKR